MQAREAALTCQWSLATSQSCVKRVSSSARDTAKRCCARSGPLWSCRPYANWLALSSPFAGEVPRGRAEQDPILSDLQEQKDPRTQPVFKCHLESSFIYSSLYRGFAKQLRNSTFAETIPEGRRISPPPSTIFDNESSL
jgi:hypothetical protein